MIVRQCFVNEWVRAKASEIGCRNPVMLEKAIVALQLLGHLAETGLPIQFKSGTSLLLRLNPIRRLAIDVDIVTQVKPEELAAALKTVAKLAPFTVYGWFFLRLTSLISARGTRVDRALSRMAATGSIRWALLINQGVHLFDARCGSEHTLGLGYFRRGRMTVRTPNRPSRRASSWSMISSADPWWMPANQLDASDTDDLMLQ